ncbi:hypothetical protein EC912_103178 [Luteibacter rhizovicinus]|uniref:Uncharacterized protein n=1 Tax=Luteibacter rhizovicinus TaxID=242606 RepID=A0A4R3YU46_9GAMM|nr:hypothetical protein [Luteibacter rhizovicinus]TCV94693.1 hypothetical protein EC912_103178 [Luteibacter rhizovicinus]
MKPLGQRFLVIYSGVLTAVFAVTVLSGFVSSPKSMTLEQLDVQRINVREPDGTLRLIVSSKGKAPGVFVKDKEYPHPAGRREAGMIFLNGEGTENGGLTFGGEKGKDGVKRSGGHLSFDAYEQDQTMALDAEQDGNRSSTKLQFTDYPDYSIMEEIDLFQSIKDLPRDQQEARFKVFFAERGGPTPRMILGRNAKDGSVMLNMADMKGNPRIVMQVAADGTPSLRMLDEKGKVVGEMRPGD